MKTKFSNNSFISRMSYKKLNNAGRYVATIAAILFLAIPQAWGVDYCSRLKGLVGDGRGGNVFVSTSTTKPNSYTADTYVTSFSNKGATTTFCIWAEPTAGYYFVNWGEKKVNGTIKIGDNNISATTTADCQNASPRSYDSYDLGIPLKYYMDYTVTANFAAIKVNS